MSHRTIHGSREHPEYFIQGSAEDARNNPSSYIEVNGNGFRVRARSLFSSLA